MHAPLPPFEPKSLGEVGNDDPDHLDEESTAYGKDEDVCTPKN